MAQRRQPGGPGGPQQTTLTFNLKEKPPHPYANLMRRMVDRLQEVQQEVAQETASAIEFEHTSKKAIESIARQLDTVKSAFHSLMDVLMEEMQQLETSFTALQGEHERLQTEVGAMDQRVQTNTIRLREDLHSMQKDTHQRCTSASDEVSRLECQLVSLCEKEAFLKQNVQTINDTLAKRQGEVEGAVTTLRQEISQIKDTQDVTRRESRASVCALETRLDNLCEALENRFTKMERAQQTHWDCLKSWASRSRSTHPPLPSALENPSPHTPAPAATHKPIITDPDPHTHTHTSTSIHLPALPPTKPIDITGYSHSVMRDYVMGKQKQTGPFSPPTVSPTGIGKGGSSLRPQHLVGVGNVPSLSPSIAGGVGGVGARSPPIPIIPSAADEEDGLGMIRGGKIPDAARGPPCLSPLSPLSMSLRQHQQQQYPRAALGGHTRGAVGVDAALPSPDVDHTVGVGGGLGGLGGLRREQRDGEYVICKGGVPTPMYAAAGYVG